MLFIVLSVFRSRFPLAIAKQKKTGTEFSVAGFTTRSLTPVVTTLGCQFIASTRMAYRRRIISRDRSRENLSGDPEQGLDRSERVERLARDELAPHRLASCGIVYFSDQLTSVTEYAGVDGKQETERECSRGAVRVAITRSILVRESQSADMREA